MDEKDIDRMKHIIRERIRGNDENARVSSARRARANEKWWRRRHELTLLVRESVGLFSQRN